MFDFGIVGYQPVWLNHRSDVVREHAHRLRGLAYRTLTRVWMVWDLQGDEWFCDCPVLFDFDGEQVEIRHPLHFTLDRAGTGGEGGMILSSPVRLATPRPPDHR